MLAKEEASRARRARARKRPQTSAALKFCAPADETSNDRCSNPKPIEASRCPRPSPQPNHATVRRWTDAGHINCYRTPGGQRRFSRAQLDEFIASMQRSGSAEHPQVVAHDARVA
jgi:excisionase family DNA binding protein